MSPYQRSIGWVRNFSGVIAAAVTPFAEDGALDSGRIPALVDLLIERGVDGIMVGGTTGEFVTMTPSERADALAAFVGAINGRVPIIAHVGAANIYATQTLTATAVELNVDAIAAMTPQFFPATDAAIEQYFTDVASAAPHLPMFIYEFPARAGNTITPPMLECLLNLPNLAGIKVSAGRLDEIINFMVFEPDITVICGNDDLQADFIAAGGRAVVSGNATVYPEVSKSIFNGLMSGKEGDVERRALVDLAVLSHAGAPDQLKRLLRERGVDVGFARCRTYLPHKDTFLGATSLPESVAKILAEAGFAK